jgi:hypothetical protein
MNDDELAAIKAAEIKAGLDWTLENAHPLLMAIGPLVAALAEARAGLGMTDAELEGTRRRAAKAEAALAEAHRTLADVEAERDELRLRHSTMRTALSFLHAWPDGVTGKSMVDAADILTLLDRARDASYSPPSRSGAESAGEQP